MHVGLIGAGNMARATARRLAGLERTGVRAAFQDPTDAVVDGGWR
jgi:3-hydroxyisobutyrate dehydrogenase-like beta-hydroxyacid dehydrogenase